MIVTPLNQQLRSHFGRAELIGWFFSTLCWFLAAGIAMLTLYVF